MDKKTALIEWGLNEKEASTYLFLIENGLSSVQEISKKTGILRQTVYEIVNKLEHYGLISEISQNKKTFFQAAKPQKLVSLLDEKKSIINSVLPSLEELEERAKSDSNVRVFKGVKGIKTINQEVLECKKIKTLLPDIGEEFMKEFYIENFSIKRIEKKIPIKVLRGEVKTIYQKTIKTDKEIFREVKFNKELTPIKAQYIIYGNSLAIISFHGEPFGVVIKDPLIHNSIEIMFDVLWKQAKP